MKILLLAPHPYYQERGTPIAVDLLVNALSERGDHVDILTFHEGEDRKYDNTKIFRIKPFRRIKNIKPGFSVNKLICDALMFFKMFGIIRKNKYDLIHAVEEASFMALVAKILFGIPYIYDVDSSMTTQLVDKYPSLKHIRALLAFIESIPMKYAKCVVPMCDALADTAKEAGAKNTFVLKDVSLLDSCQETGSVDNLRDEYEISGILMMYIGNLESYQGIDLMLESFQKIYNLNIDANLVIIGGTDSDVNKYIEKSKALNIADRVHLLGKKSVTHMRQYMAQADIMLSPRIKGINTPMKVYSYLDSGTAVLATNLPTHTQVMNDDIALLVDADIQSYAEGMQRLIDDKNLRERLASQAKDYIQKEHSMTTFKSKVNQLFAFIGNKESLSV